MTLQQRPEALLEVCTIALELFRQISIYLQPILPELVARAGALFGRPEPVWADAASPLGAVEIGWILS